MVEVDPPDAWLTILSAGRCYREVRQALADLGLVSDDDVRGAGIRLVRLGMIYPLEPGVRPRRRPRACRRLLVVEEKRPFVERFVREQLYDLAERPRVTGKRDEQDRPLIPVDGELTADRLRPILARRLAQRLSTPALIAAAEPPRPRTQLTLLPPSPAATRTAGFCSGCPHNRSTVAGAGSPVGGGVGCHAMVMWLDRGAVSLLARWAARARSGWAGRRSPTCRTTCRTSGTARSSTPAAWPCAPRCRPGPR